MKKCIKFPSVDQFRTLVSNIQRQVNFVGLDDNSDPIYDPTIKKPTLTLIASCKLHGTNFGVSFNNIDGLWFQSRENIITSQNDNAGAAFYGEANREVWLKLINQIKNDNNINLNENSITIYAEWCGSGIQKNVGISNLDKSAFIFAVKVSPFEDQTLEKQLSAYWVDAKNLSSPDNRIYNIYDFKTFSFEVDFNNPSLIQNKLIETTMEVEVECPVAKAFGFENTIGEGIVLQLDYKGVKYFAKSKGELHAGKSKVKTLKVVDDARVNLINEIAQKCTPTWRLEQMITETFNLLNGGVVERSKIGDYLRKVIQDVMKEDLDIISGVGLEPKDVNSKISQIAKEYFFQYEKDNL